MRFLSIIGACTLLASTCAAPAVAAKNSVKTVGLYAFMPAPDVYKFWKACGYDTLQFIDHAFSAPAEGHDAIYRNTEKGIREAQAAGFKVDIIILSNVSSYPDYPFVKPVFDPTDKAAMQKRLDDIEIGVKRLKGADVFTFFGGDPGGSPVRLGPDGVRAWMDMSRKVHEMVKREAPKAVYNANIWATAAWDDISINPFKVDFWEKEVEYGKMILAEKDFIGPDCGVEFPLHNYYRSLAFKAYADAGKRPEPYPIAADIKNLKSRGVKRMWGWAHFLIDEVDDGYTGYSGVKAHPTQAETRYLHRIVSDARRIGLNGMISNSDGKGSVIEAMNVYAFAQFCRNPSLTPGQAIDEYAGFIADKGSKHALGQVIRFIENHSTWEASIPEQYRMKGLKCEYATADDALKALSAITPNPNPDFPIPEPAPKYLDRLKSRLTDIAGGMK